MPAAKGFNMIYYVEDDDNIRDLTVYALRKQGIEAEGFSCDGEFKAAVARRVPDAVLLDIMLPDTDGLAIMRRLRADRLTATVPIMMLTAKDTELDKVMALDGGADDYLTKPFSLMELASRCRALLRRGGMVKQASDVLSVGDIVLSPSHREVTVAGESLKLTLREFDLLEYLMRKPGVVFTRESLLQSVWGWDFDGGSRTVDVHVQTLRQKLGEHASAIETVRGKHPSPALDRLRFEPFHEGRAAQFLHVGPYANEGPNIERLHAFITAQGHNLAGKHHEIYLSDPRRAAPDKLKTIVRQPFAD